MAYQPETPVYDAGVFQLETNTPVLGGVGGAANTPLLALANRTAYLKQHMDALEATFGGAAAINSPAFTGTPTAPTPALGDNTGKLATTAFVLNSIAGVLNKNVAGGVNVSLTAVEAGNGILVLTGLITANIALIVPNTSKSWIIANRTTGGFTVTLKTAAGTDVVVLTRNVSMHTYCDGAAGCWQVGAAGDTSAGGSPESYFFGQL